MKSIIVSGEAFKVNEFADHEIVPLIILLQEGLGDPDAKFKAAKAIKKVIIPSLPTWAIREIGEDNYTFMLDSDEINLLLMQILKFHYEFQIERATKKNKPEELITSLRNSLFETNEALKILNISQQLGQVINISGVVLDGDNNSAKAPTDTDEAVMYTEKPQEEDILRQRLVEIEKRKNSLPE